MKKAVCALMAAVALMLCALPGAKAGAFDDDGILRLVNKQTKITKKYVPEGMILPRVPTNRKDQAESIYLRPEAAAALEEMFAAAAAEKGYTLLAVSGYRSFGIQSLLYEQAGKNQNRVAPAGASEHQLGLAMDIVCDHFRLLNSGFAQTEEGQWLYANCHRFGFILRYRRDWVETTGFANEPWHFRYLGVSHASAVAWLDVPYEAYARQAMLLPEYVLQKGNAYLLYGVMDDALNGDGCLFEELCDAACETEEEQNAVLAELTARFLPEGVTLENALANRVQ